MRTPTNEQLSDSPDLISALQNKISQLKSSLAELQRVVRVKDEALKSCETVHSHNIDGYPEHADYFDSVLVKKALECTPKDLPKFVPEEEYLRVKEEAKHFKDCMDFREAALQASLAQTETALKQIKLLKTHAEAMAKIFENSYYQGSPTIPTYEEYRKDFPKSNSTDSL